MPKNTFQRPPKVAPHRNVPRHGAPLPLPRSQARPATRPNIDGATPLPLLEALLKPERQ